MRMTAWPHVTLIAVFQGWTIRQEQAKGLVPPELRPRWRFHSFIHGEGHGILFGSKAGMRPCKVDKARNIVRPHAV